MNRNLIFLFLIILFFPTVGLSASWSDKYGEDTSPDGTEKVFLENGAATANNWMTLDTIKAWIGGGGGAVDSVFGRTGAVTAQAGDYSAYYLALATCSTIGEVPTWNGSDFVCSTPTGSGDMAKATYDTGDNGIVDNAEALLGGTWVAPGADIGSGAPVAVTGTTATFDTYNTSATDGERYQLIWNTDDPSVTCDSDHNGAFAYRRSDNSFRYCDGTAWSPLPGGDGGSGNVILTEGDTAPTAGSLPEGSLFHDTTDNTLYLQTATGLLHSGAWSWEANSVPTYTLDLTISGALSGDSITVDGTAYTASATITGLADGVQTLTQAFGDTNDTVTWSGTDAGLVTGTPPDTQIDMGGANRSLTATFGVTTVDCDNLGTWDFYYNVDHSNGTTTACAQGGIDTGTFYGDMAASSVWNSTTGGTYSVIGGNTDDYIEFPAHVTGDEGYVKLTVHAETDQSSRSTLFEYDIDLDNKISVRWRDGYGYALYRHVDGNYIYVVASSTLPLGSSAVVEARWSVSGDEMSIRVDGGTWVSTSGVVSLTGTEPTAQLIGEKYVGYSGQDMYIDDIYTSTSYDGGN